MPRAAHGENACGAVRRKLPEYLVVPVFLSDRRDSNCPFRSGMETYIHPCERRIKKCGHFTQQLSGFGVVRGRLGEVVSLVGDCRPPPPGNPHQPPIPWKMGYWPGGSQLKPANIFLSWGFTSKMQKFGGTIFRVSLSISFNKKKILTNLKDLNPSEYFKEIRSYSSCTGNKPVLKFGSFPLPPVWVNGSGTPIYSDNKCSRNVGIIYALPVL